MASLDIEINDNPRRPSQESSNIHNASSSKQDTNKEGLPVQTTDVEEDSVSQLPKTVREI
jgi:hypothetical protein